MPPPTRKDAAMRTNFQLSENSSDSNRGDMNKRGTKRSHMRRLNSRVVLAAAGGLALAGAMSVPAGAATSAHLVARGASGSLRFSPGIPTSKIKGEGQTAFYKPSALTVSEDTSGGNCGESNPPAAFEAQEHRNFDGLPDLQRRSSRSGAPPAHEAGDDLPVRRHSGGPSDDWFVQQEGPRDLPGNVDHHRVELTAEGLHGGRAAA